MAAVRPSYQGASAPAGGVAGNGPGAAAMEARLQRLETLLQQRLEVEAQKRQALEERLARLERGSSAAAVSSPVVRGAKPLIPASAEGEGVAEGSQSSGSEGEEEDIEFCCKLAGEDGTSYEVAKSTSEALQETYVLEESIWDASIFAFTQTAGRWLSLNIVVLMALNIITQSFFIVVVYKYMCDDPISAEFLGSLLKFRASIAHSAKYADFTQGMSLASQVCNEDEKIPWAGTQLGLLSDIGPARRGGIYLCTLVSLIWLLTLIGEVDNSLRFGAIMTSLLKGRRTYLVTDKADGDDEGGDVGSSGLRLVSIGHARFCFILVFVVLPRLLIVVWLALVGIHFLSVTTSMGDLLLNSLALAFIVEIDNVIFAGFAPQKVKAIIRTVAPIPFPQHHPRQWRMRGLSTLSKVCLVLVVLLLVFHFRIRPFYWRMDQAWDILCSGDRNFIYAVNPATRLVEVVPSFKDPDKDWYSQELAVLQITNLKIRAGPGFQPPQAVLDTLDTSTLRAVVHLGPQDLRERLTELEFHSSGRTSFSSELNVGALTPSFRLMFELRKLVTGGVLDAAEGLSCADLVFSSSKQIMETHLRDVALGRSSCSEARHLCDWPNMTSLRAICPVTCGCRTLLAPRASFFAGTGFGCPAKCEADAIVNLAGMQGNRVIQCADSAPSRFLVDSALRKYFQLGVSYLLSQTETLLTVYAALTRGGEYLGIAKEQSEQAFRSIVNGSFVETILNGHWNLVPGHTHPRGLQGCQFWTSWEVKFVLGVDFCESRDFRSLRPYCPVSCNCRSGRTQCPSSCSAQLAG